jgi:hypothetical protein
LMLMELARRRNDRSPPPIAADCRTIHDGPQSTQSSRSAPSVAAPAVAPEPTLLFIANADLTG